MKILQVNNIVSHHQLPFARELAKLVGEGNFLFAALGRPDSERVKNGWLKNHSEDWIIYPNESLNELEMYEDFWQNADVVICGERLTDKMQKRLDQEKLCFYMSERWWKPPIGALRLLHPKFFKMTLNYKNLFKSKYFHYLSIGPFAARDMKILTRGKVPIWNWAYLTESPKLKENSRLKDPSQPLTLLWVGRMLKWKKVDLLIETLGLLQDKGCDFKLTLIGDGPERKTLEKLASKLLVRHSYEFTDFIPSAEIPTLMSKYDVYIFPSNAYEGWGAVVNEAMSVGCTVIASDKTGAGATLIESGTNGLLFESGSKVSLYNALDQIFNDPTLLDKFGKEAKVTIESEWNPKVAAKKFFELATALLNEEQVMIVDTGLLSRAD